MNRGDSLIAIIDIEIENEPIENNYADEIEVTFNDQRTRNCVRKTLSSGGVIWSSDYGKYGVVLSQEDTFKFTRGKNTFQVRVLHGDEVISSDVEGFLVGDANSSEVLED